MSAKQCIKASSSKVQVYSRLGSSPNRQTGSKLRYMSRAGHIGDECSKAGHQMIWQASTQTKKVPEHAYRHTRNLHRCNGKDDTKVYSSKEICSYQGRRVPRRHRNDRTDQKTDARSIE